jgi:hypothetical protein
MNGEWQRLDSGMAGVIQRVLSQIASIVEGRITEGSRQFTVSLSQDADEVRLRLVPRINKMRRAIDRIEVRLTPDTHQITELTIHETNSDWTRIEFSEIQINLNLPATTFDRRDPAALEAILEVAGSKAPGPAPLAPKAE